MNETKPCPEKDSILDYLLGKSPQTQLEMLEDHFAKCVQCEETLRGISASDTLSGLVETAAKLPVEASPGEQEFVRDLIYQIQNQETHPRFTDNPPVNRIDFDSANEIIRLLPSSEQPECLGRLGPYQVECVLGSGSTSVVFLAEDQDLNRKVALKVLRPSLGPAAKVRFVDEAKAVASIEHPNVVAIYQVGIQDDLAFIAMQWVPGETLEQRFTKVAFLPEAEVLQIARQIASGLSIAHQRQMIHRDIKPANIWLSADNDHVIILDFGLARVADDDPKMTQTGVLAGTPNYMSPEQSRGIELDARSDLFGLGCLMYRAATGKLPFEGNGVLATLQEIQNAEPTAPKVLNPHLSDDFSNLLLCLLEKQPSNRPDSATDLLHAFDQPSNQWKFQPNKVSHLAQPANSKRAETNSRFPGWIVWISLTVLIGLLGFGGFMFGPDVIRIATNQGELIIQSEDDDIKIEVLSNGKLIKVIDTQTDQAINIKSGKYEFQVVDSRNGFKVSPSEIEMTRGGRRIVVISKLPKQQPSAFADDRQPQSTNPLKETFDGRTFDQWVAILKTERNPITIRMGLKALAELTDDDPVLTDRAIHTVLPILRKHGNIAITGDKEELVEDLNQFFGHLEPERLLSIILNEVKNGTEQSRSHLAWMVQPVSIYMTQTKQIAEYQKIIEQQIDKLILVSAELMKSNDLTKVDAGERLLYSAFQGTFGRRVTGFANQTITGRISEKAARTLKQLLEQSRFPREKIAYSNLLVQYDRVDRQLIETVIKIMSDRNLSGQVGYALQFELLPRVPKQFAKPLIQPILQLISDEVRVNRIYQHTIKRTFGFNKVELIQTGLMDQLGKYGAVSESALPWLDKVATSDSPLAKKAKSVASIIRADLQKTQSKSSDPEPKPSGN